MNEISLEDQIYPPTEYEAIPVTNPTLNLADRNQTPLTKQTQTQKNPLLQLIKEQENYPTLNQEYLVKL